MQLIWHLFPFLLSALQIHHWGIRRAISSPDGYPRDIIAIQKDSYDYDDANVNLIGPEIRILQNETIQIHVTNLLDDTAIAIHWHGIHMRQNPWMDGALGVTQVGILPGHCFTYEFQVNQSAGTYWYHAFSNTQKSDGLFGALIVLENGNDTNGGNDHVVILQDWFHESYQTLFAKYLLHSHVYQGFLSHIVSQAASVLIHGFGQFNCNDCFFTNEECNEIEKCGWGYLTTNSCVVPSVKTVIDCIPSRPPLLKNCEESEAFFEMQCVPQAKMRLRLIAAGFSFGLRFWIDRHNVTIIAKDGVPIVPIPNQKAVYLHLGERIDVEFSCDQNVSYDYYFFVMIAHEYYGPNFHLYAPNISSFGILHYSKSSFRMEAQDPPEKWPYGLNRGQKMFFYPYVDSESLAPPAELQFVLRPQIRGYWQTSDNKTTRLEWWEMNSHMPFYIPHNYSVLQTCEHGGNFTTIYGTKYGSLATPLIYHLEYDLHSPKTYEFVLFNNEEQPHPWHVHGHSVYVLCIGYIKEYNITNFPRLEDTVANYMLADTFVIPAHGFVIFRLTANNPGPWVIRSQMNFQAFVGLSFLISVAPNTTNTSCMYFESFKPVPSSDFLKTLQTTILLFDTFGWIAIGFALGILTYTALFIVFRSCYNWWQARKFFRMQSETLQTYVASVELKTQ